MNNLEIAKKNNLIKEKNLSKYATLSVDAKRLKKEEEDIRPAYFHDTDRIIHSLSYTRYLNKTQVYSFNKNDHISKRITHVQIVSKIARTIGRALNLNEDLIEAISLAHDIGHTPLGHKGEAILNKISKKELNEFFAHNIQGVRYYNEITNNGEGLNLTIQVLDGIMNHNGEMLSPIYEPMPKTMEEFFQEYQEGYHDLEKTLKYRPMTLEGCVVRISDIISYIGRDIEDAIITGNLKRSDIPKDIKKVLGDNNKDIVNTLILDIINESMNKPYLKMSDEVYKALTALKKFNYDHIYKYSMTDKNSQKYETGINKLFYIYLKDIKDKTKETTIYPIFLSHQNKDYIKNNNDKRIVLDFIAGMTDDFLENELNKYVYKNNS